MRKVFYSVIAAIIILIGCKDEGLEKVGGIYGVITDKATGEPIQSAGVSLDTGVQTITGSEGQYEFIDLKAGEYKLTVTKTGYVDLINHRIVVEAGKNAKGDVQIEKLPLALRVVDASGQDIDALDFGSETSVVSRSFNIFNDGPVSLEWIALNNCAWITELSRSSGTLEAGKQQPVVVTIDREKLGGGDNTYILNISSDNGSKELTITAVGAEKALPTLNTLPATEIAATTAVFNGEITATGSPAYTECGFVYSTSTMPTVENTIAKLTVAVSDNRIFAALATNLTLGQTYYVRAYAINSIGTAYSTNEVSFTTTAIMPVVTTQDVTNKNTGNGIATFNGTIVSVGDPAYTERGFVYGTQRTPNVDDDIKRAVSGTGTGEFSSNISGLILGNTYYVRAYATNAVGTVYGTEVECDFKYSIPVVTTQNPTNIGKTTATFHGNVTSAGGPPYTERGFVYCTTINPEPEIDGINVTKTVVPGSGDTGAYSGNITNLTEGTAYYMRAYAINEAGIAYGQSVEFSTEADWIVLQSDGIMVQKYDIGSGATWSEANSLCQASRLGGYSDWRLPTIGELRSLYNQQSTIGGFSTSWYWSSSTYSSYSSWAISFWNGDTDIYTNSNTLRVRAVRTLP